MAQTTPDSADKTTAKSTTTAASPTSKAEASQLKQPRIAKRASKRRVVEDEEDNEGEQKRAHDAEQEEERSEDKEEQREGDEQEGQEGEEEDEKNEAQYEFEDIVYVDHEEAPEGGDPAQYFRDHPKKPNHVRIYWYYALAMAKETGIAKSKLKDWPEGKWVLSDHAETRPRKDILRKHDDDVDGEFNADETFEFQVNKWPDSPDSPRGLVKKE